MGLADKFFIKITELQCKHTKLILLFILGVTLFLSIGVSMIEMESDFSKMMPQDLDYYKLNNKINEKFGGQDIILILAELDYSLESTNTINDIRDPAIINYLKELTLELAKEPSIYGVMSIGNYFQNIDIDSISESKFLIKNIPGAEDLFSRDYSKTLLYISTDVGGSNKKITDITTLIEDKLSEISKPSGLKLEISGGPPVSVLILDLLGRDAIYTLSIAALLILVLLIILLRSFKKAIIVFIPLLLGIIWTMGTLGWLGIKLSVATAGISAMIIGLGVEYGIFMYSRYEEERKNLQTDFDALSISVPEVGKAILSSGGTTIVGFLALTLSTIPMLGNLGASLATGIIFCLLGAIVVQPAIIIAMNWISPRIKPKLIKFIERDE